MTVELAIVPNHGVDSESVSDTKPNQCNVSYYNKPRTVAIGPVLPPKTGHCNMTHCSPIEYLSSDRIVIFSIRSYIVQCDARIDLPVSDMRMN